MRLIDAPIGIFRFDGELVLKTEYCSENKQSGKYIPDCYIVRTGEYFFGGAKTANELNNLDVEPVDFAELLPTVTDTISRAKAIDACGGYLVPASIIRELPSAQPERIKARWILAENQRPEDMENDNYLFICSNCGSTDLHSKRVTVSYCWNCGAEMLKEATE